MPLRLVKAPANCRGQLWISKQRIRGISRRVDLSVEDPLDWLAFKVRKDSERGLQLDAAVWFLNPLVELLVPDSPRRVKVALKRIRKPVDEAGASKQVFRDLLPNTGSCTGGE